MAVTGLKAALIEAYWKVMNQWLCDLGNEKLAEQAKRLGDELVRLGLAEEMK